MRKTALFSAFISLVLSSCIVYKQQNTSGNNLKASLSSPNWYLHAGKLNYRFSEKTFSENNLSFQLDTNAVKKSANYSQYRRAKNTLSELHLYVDDAALLAGKTQIGDTVYANIKPVNIKRVVLFSPKEQWVFYQKNIAKYLEKLKIILGSNGKYYQLFQVQLDENELTAFVNPYLGSTDDKTLLDTKGTILLKGGNVQENDKSIKLKLAELYEINYQSIDARKTFLANAGLATASSTFFILLLLSSADYANSDY